MISMISYLQYIHDNKGYAAEMYNLTNSAYLFPHKLSGLYWD